MTVYIRDFQFVKYRKFRSIEFKYFTGYKWKHLSLVDPFNGDNVAVYTRHIMDAVTKDICGKQMDVLERNKLLKKYELDIMCITQLNPQEFKDAVKLFS